MSSADPQANGSPPITPKSSPQSDRVSDTVSVAIVAWLLLPGLLAGWKLRRALGEKQWSWRRRGLHSATRRLLIIASLLGTYVVVWQGVDLFHNVREDKVDPAQLIVGILAAQLALGISAALVTLPRRWTLLLRGELPAGQEDALARAGWLASVADALHRIRTIQVGRLSRVGSAIHRTPAGYVGVGVAEDKRWPLSRWFDQGRRRPQGWFTALGLARLPDRIPRILMLAASGHGKTVAISAVLQAALRQGNRAIFVDCKGDDDDAVMLAALAEQMGKRTIRWPESPMDLWRGDRHAVVSVVKTVLPRHPYWESLGGWVLDAITVQAGPWRTTKELLDRLHTPRSVVSDSKTLSALLQRTGSIPAHMAVYQIVAAKLAPIAHLIDGGPDSWAIDDDVDLIVVSADIGADQRLAACLSGLIADLNAYRISRRTKECRPLMVAFDELQVLLGLTQPPDMAWLAEQCRSQNIGLIYATQSLAGLGDSADRILGAGMDVLTGRLDDPDRFAQIAGTRRIAEQGWQKSSGAFTSVATARTQHTLRLDPNRIREMPQGTWALLSQGRIGYLAAEQPLLQPTHAPGIALE